MMRTLEIFDSIDSSNYPERGLQLPGRIAGWYKPVWKDFFNQHLTALHPIAHAMAAYGA